MKKIILISLALFLSSCAGMKLKKYKGNHKATFIEKTTYKKDQAYEGTMVYLAKHIDNSNYAIRMKDKGAGRIVAKIKYGCKGIKRPDVIVHIESTPMDMNVDVSIRDMKIKYELEITGFKKDVGQYGIFDMYIAEAPGQKEAVNNCFKQLKTELFKALTNSSVNSEW